ncbi:dual specificity protein phosphatase 23-like isoform X2 [Cryptotermes secundus]|uniref:dual specificity protein phosphatase 23-like isoform X2 n=1 Tax=Cryptotermes secundus TaxID=105785 RepID=UPI001454D400|nr:dual specificity protein phosphatase 23-like isoform X2 [Cryptotermes secundus]
MQEAIVQASSVSGISSRWVRVFPKFCSKHHMQEGIVQASSVSAISSRMAGAGMSHNHKWQEEGVYPPNNFSWIVKEELAAMAWPRMPSNLRFLEKQGIKHLVTLSPEMRPPIHTFAELKWTEIPVEEFCSPSVTQIKEFIDICQKSKTKNEVTNLGCGNGPFENRYIKIYVQNYTSHTIKITYIN